LYIYVLLYLCIIWFVIQDKHPYVTWWWFYKWNCRFIYLCAWNFVIRATDKFHENYCPTN